MDTKRFNSPHYKRQIHAVRAYKRRSYRIPDSAFQKFLYKIGLGTILRQIILGAFLIGLIYLAYFAKFLTINNVQIAGADPSAQAEIQNQFANYKMTFFGILPQRNILFFNSARFKRYLLEHDNALQSVDSVGRKFNHTILVSVTQRLAAFNLENQNNVYYLNSDGSLGPQISQPDPKYQLLTDPTADQLSPGQLILNSQKYAFLKYISENFQSQTGVAIDHFELPGINSSDLILHTQPGFTVSFDTGTDPKIYLGRFFSIWSQLSASQQKKLSYVDLRFDLKAYLCYKGDACDSNNSTQQNGVTNANGAANPQPQPMPAPINIQGNKKPNG